MKIIILCSNIIPSGGTERAIYNLTNLLVKDSRYNISIISACSGNTDIPYFEFKNVNIYHLELPELQINFFNKLNWYRVAQKRLRKKIKELGPDLILGYGHNMNIMLPFIVKREKIYGCEHINYDTIPYSSKLIMKLIYPFLNGIVVLSKTAQKNYCRLNQNTYVIPNAVSFTQNLPSSLLRKRMIMIGRLSEEKGYERLVPIAQEIKSQVLDWKIDIYGDGPLKGKLKKIFEQEDLSDLITLKGNTTDIQKELNESSFLLMTSYTEALPMAIIEAKTCGVPAIAYECEGTKELITDSVDGFLVKSSKEFSTKIKLLINDRALLLAMGLNAYISADKYSESNIKEYWDRLFSI